MMFLISVSRGLPVLFVHGEQKAGQHNEDHHERRKACACAAFEQKEKRQSNKERRRKEYELPFCKVKGNLCLLCVIGLLERVHTP